MARPASRARIDAHARWVADYNARQDRIAAREAHAAALAAAPVQGCELPPIPEGDVLAWLLDELHRA